MPDESSKYLLAGSRQVEGSDEEERLGLRYQVTEIKAAPWTEKIVRSGIFTVTTRERTQAFKLKLSEEQQRE